MKPTMLFFLLVVLYSCNTQKDKTKNSIEVKSKTEMIEAARKYGDIITKETKKTLGSNLIKAVNEGGVAHAIEFCSLNAYPLVDSLEEKYSAIIRRASHKSRNPNDNPTEYEAKKIEQYQELMKTGIVGEPDVELLDGKTLVYTKPIILDNQVCLNCHGIPGQQIVPESLDLIKVLYPEDKAVGFQVGDLRGIWSITFNKNQLISAGSQN